MRDIPIRVTWLMGIVAAALVLTLVQLYRLTIAQSDSWRTRAQDQILREMDTNGPRGSIFDRKGRALATSEPAFAAVLLKQNPQYVEQILPKLSLLLAAGDQQKARNIADEVRRKVREHQQDLRQFEPILIDRKLSRSVVSTFLERRSEFDGVILVTESARNYPNGKLAGSLLGYVGAISAEQLTAKGFENYHGDQVVGKDGLELFYEHELQGRSGTRSVKVNLYGQPVSEPEEKPALPGDSLHLTLDLDLQRVAEEALIKQMDWIGQQQDPEANPIRGVLVVEEVRTGAILAMASVPTFDPNLFSGGISNDQWQALMNNPALPMQNWALAGYAPGSTYKMGVGLAGLELGAIGPYDTIDCAAQYWNYHKPKNWTLYDQGPADVARALAISCDPFFYEMGYRMTIDPMAAFLSQFGFGQKTGIDLPGEQTGNLPTQASYGADWMPGQVLSVAIGQGNDLVTPLQLANYTATIANGGTRYRPFLVSEIRSAAGDLVKRNQPQVIGRINADPANMRRIQEGMRQAVTEGDGTAYSPMLGFKIETAAKTGSAETGHAWSNAFTVAYAPYENPEIAISVVIEGGAHGSWVTPAARAVMAQYFGIKEGDQKKAIRKTD